jgi:transposase
MDKKEIRNLIYQKYGTFLLSRQQVAKVLNKSVATIDRWKKQGLYLEYKKLGNAKNATVEYPIDSVVNYILNNNQKIV